MRPKTEIAINSETQRRQPAVGTSLQTLKGLFYLLGKQS